MIAAMSSTCRAEAEPAAAAEDDADAEAEAGRVHGGNNYSQFWDRCSEASVVGKVLAITFVANSICGCDKGGNAEAEAEAEAQKTSNENKNRGQNAVQHM